MTLQTTNWSWPSWRGDEAVRRLTPDERGIWIDLISLAAAGNPTGFVVDAQGRHIPLEEIGRFTNCADLERLSKLINGIVEKGAASRDRTGRLFNRRMVRDSSLSVKRSEAGKNGVIAKKNKRDRELLKQSFVAEFSNKDETDISITPSLELDLGVGQGVTTARAREKRKIGSRLPDDWQLSQPDIDLALAKGMPRDRIPTAAEKFKNHWLNKPGKDALKLDWHRAWLTWVLNDREYYNGNRNGNSQQANSGDHRQGGKGRGFSAIALERAKRAAGVFDGS